MKETADRKHAILDLEGATCTSCSIAIEHLGRRLDGVDDIYVDRATSTIQVDYNGNRAIVDRLCEFVGQLGYKASLRAIE